MAPIRPRLEGLEDRWVPSQMVSPRHGLDDLPAAVRVNSHPTAASGNDLPVNPALRFTGPSSLPDATVGQPYRQQLTTAGGVGPITFTVAQGALPPGWSLDSATGELKGSSDAAGAFHATLQATDRTGATVTWSPAITVDPVVPAQVPVTGNPGRGLGAFDPATGHWYLRGTISPGAPDAGSFAYGAPGWIPVTGDWSGTGQLGIGVVDPTTATWYLRNSTSAGSPDVTPFQYGLPGWIPVTGDWTGSGHTGIGMFDPATATWYLRNSDGPGVPDIVLQYGMPGARPVVGDWTGVGHTGVGVVDLASASWYLRNEPNAGAPDAGHFQFGMSGWTPVAGNWDASMHTGIGMFDPGTTSWYLRDNASAGTPDHTPFPYGTSAWTPLGAAPDLGGAWAREDMLGNHAVLELHSSLGAMYYEFEPVGGFQNSTSTGSGSPTRAVVVESAGPLDQFTDNPARIDKLIPVRAWRLTDAQLQNAQNRLADIDNRVGNGSYLYSVADAASPNNQLVLSGGGVRYRSCWGFVSDVLAGLDATEPVALVA
jgi:hypothetical protein